MKDCCHQVLVRRLFSNMKVAMKDRIYPELDVLLARLIPSEDPNLVRCDRNSDIPFSIVVTKQPPNEAFLRRLSIQIEMRFEDLCLVFDKPIADSALRCDEAASRQLPQLVRKALSLSCPDQDRLRDYYQSLPDLSRTIRPRTPRPYEQYPPGFGSLLVRMLALRNLDWVSGSQVMCRMSGVCLSASTIGAIGRGDRELDSELLNGFATVFGTPIRVLGELFGITEVDVSRDRVSRAQSYVAELIWNVRHMTSDQIVDISRLATTLNDA